LLTKGKDEMKTLLTAAVVALTATSAFARDNIQIAGSSTVLPYASIVAESFGENFDFPTPVVESGGSSAGLKRFCEGTGETTIDIANASRQIKSSELETCAANGVDSITEVRIGYDGIVFAAHKSLENFSALTTGQIYQALSRHTGFTKWSEIDPSLPDVRIEANIPGTKHGTREVFEEKVMIAGCEAVGDYDKFLEELGDKKKAHAKCVEVDQFKAIDIDGDYTETLARIESSKTSIGVFGLAFYYNNTDKLQLATINGVEGSQETIANGTYPVSRPLYFYVKDAHVAVIPGLAEFVNFFVADAVAGPDGPLAEYGLVSDPELATTQEAVSKLGN
jgi:phosphate transport system substrate-binding protein